MDQLVERAARDERNAPPVREHELGPKPLLEHDVQDVVRAHDALRHESPSEAEAAVGVADELASVEESVDEQRGRPENAEGQRCGPEPGGRVERQEEPEPRPEEPRQQAPSERPNQRRPTDRRCKPHRRSLEASIPRAHSPISRANARRDSWFSSTARCKKNPNASPAAAMLNGPAVAMLTSINVSTISRPVCAISATSTPS